jgi:hypothetical protein
MMISMKASALIRQLTCSNNILKNFSCLFPRLPHDYLMSYSLTRTSMALDAWTIQALKDLSEKWNISKAEVIRRAVRQLKEKADTEEQTLSPLEALEWLQEGGGLVAEEAEAYRAEMLANREARRLWWES